MKAVTQDMQSGGLAVTDVPPPALQPGGVLVRVRRSLISLGTERAIIALAKKGPIGKAKDRPDLVRKVMNRAKQEGLWNTYQVVKNLISSPIPLGYSCAGEVIAVGRDAGEFRVGDRVACAGLNFANHAEVDYIPRNLAARIPDEVSYDSACFVALGAIAMQGVRLAQIELGETVVVLGLGLVGQIAAQLARCAGATVLAFDPEPSKVKLGLELGAHHAATSAEQLAALVQDATDRHGADAVLVCAATKSDGPLRQAAEVSRLKGRVVIVGDVGLQVERRPFFEKELSLVVSRSYGPGRYDPNYEVHGTDYPLSYVRWTERRNMSSFLDQIARGTLAVEPLITQRYPIEDAETAYEVVTGKREVPAIAIVLEYEGEEKPVSKVTLPAASRPARADTIKLGVIGAGQFAKGILLPEFLRQKGVQIDAVCTASGLTSQHSAGRYGARFCTSDPADVLNDPAINAVIIATRHDQHASLTGAALAAGKAAFVEKPLALTEESLREVEAAVENGTSDRVMVGFNRRFAPLAVQCRDFFQNRREPLSLLYRINAGRLPADSWVLDPVTGGGRIIGEVCHFVDLCAFMTGALPERVFAEEVKSADQRLGDREAVSISIRFADHSIATIQYLSNGDTSVAKEYLEVSAGGRSAILENFRTLSLHRDNRRRRTRLLNQAKGHAQEVAAFIDAVRSGDAMPIAFPVLAAVTRATFMIHESLGSGMPVDFAVTEEDSV
jgi:predicted dehydrogenase/threonine dehydrogenase-like Zn-dependent dehydrogenase